MGMKPSSLLRRRRAQHLIVGVFCGMLAFAAAAPAATITGTVTNGTTKTPAAGDAVTLIALDQRMQEIAKTKTDAQGHFSIDSPDPGMHLIRIDHQGAAYFQPAPPNTPNVNVQVFDVATGKVALTGPTSPVLDGGGGFALSLSGKRFAVLNEGAIQVYELPAPPPLPEDEAPKP